MKKHEYNHMRLDVGRKFPISPSLFVALEALLLVFVLEILSRRSLADAAHFLIDKPILFFYNWSIVSVTLALAMLTRKKAFSVTLITVIWLTAGVANCILLGFRNESPLTAIDLQLGIEGLTMMPSYFEVWQIVLIGIGIAGVIAFLIILGIRSPKYRRDWQRAFLRLAGFCVVFLVYTICLFSQKDMISRNLRPSLYKAYKDYGFSYCFCYSFFDVGIQRPKNYSPTEVASITSEIGIDAPIDTEEAEDDNTFFDEIIDSVRLNLFESEPEAYSVEAVEAIRELLKTSVDSEETYLTPNIIFVQLESFFDPTEITTLQYSKDPIPNFRRLCEEHTTGKLSVPTVSGGTVNTEFEILTGCSMDFFGAGEFPYYSILRKNTCETLATDLRVNDYTATAIHNYTGSFYYRNSVYENMGFHRFVSQEYMNDFETNLRGWPKDNILVSEIRKAVSSTEGPDFVYVVSMQTHGRYIPLPEDVTAPITVTGDKSEEDLRIIEYYVSQLAETDEMIARLTDLFSQINEPTMIVFFGDHLPSLNLTDEELRDGDIYTTRYVIWDNFGLPKNDRDLQAYQLGAWSMKQIGNNIGVMVRFHQMQMDNASYRKNLEILEYDMLYGEHYVYGGAQHIYDNALQMGIDPIRIQNIYVKFGNLFIEGENFTYASHVYIDDDEEKAVFVSPSLLIVPDCEPEDGNILYVAQISEENTELSRTESVSCSGLKTTIYD